MYSLVTTMQIMMPNKDTLAKDLTLSDKEALAFKLGWDAALCNLWFDVKEVLPQTDHDVLVLTKKGKAFVNRLYIPTNYKGERLPNCKPEWKGSRSVKDSIIAWMEIPIYRI